MSKSLLSSLPLLLLAAFVCIALPSRGQNQGANQQAVQLPEGDGKATVQAACGVCHAMTQVTNNGHDREEWITTLHMMVNVGAPPEVRALVLRCVDKKTENRPRSFQEVVEELRALIPALGNDKTQPVAAKTAPLPTNVPLTSVRDLTPVNAPPAVAVVPKKSMLPWVFLSLLAAIAVAGGAWWVVNKPKPPVKPVWAVFSDSSS